MAKQIKKKGFYIAFSYYDQNYGIYRYGSFVIDVDDKVTRKTIIEWENAIRVLTHADICNIIFYKELEG